MGSWRCAIPVGQARSLPAREERNCCGSHSHLHHTRVWLPQTSHRHSQCVLSWQTEIPRAAGPVPCRALSVAPRAGRAHRGGSVTAGPAQGPSPDPGRDFPAGGGYWPSGTRALGLHGRQSHLYSCGPAAGPARQCRKGMVSNAPENSSCCTGLFGRTALTRTR